MSLNAKTAPLQPYQPRFKVGDLVTKFDKRRGIRMGRVCDFFIDSWFTPTNPRRYQYKVKWSTGYTSYNAQDLISKFDIDSVKLEDYE